MHSAYSGFHGNLGFPSFIWIYIRFITYCCFASNCCPRKSSCLANCTKIGFSQKHSASKTSLSGVHSLSIAHVPSSFAFIVIDLTNWLCFKETTLDARLAGQLHRHLCSYRFLDFFVKSIKLTATRRPEQKYCQLCLHHQPYTYATCSEATALMDLGILRVFIWRKRA
jgi:hypothetical protein